MDNILKRIENYLIENPEKMRSGYSATAKKFDSDYERVRASS